MSDRETKVFEFKIVVTVMGEANDVPDFIENYDGMSLSEIGSLIDEGELIGSIEAISLEEINTDQVAHRLQSLGNDGTFFDMEEEYPKSAPVDDPAGRILRAQMSQGWSNETLEMLGRRFIDEAGLSSAFAAFLESQAAEENNMSQDHEGPM